MRINSSPFFCILVLSVLFLSCSEKTEQFESEPLSAYVPLETGKYITYRVDSLVFTNFGRNTEIHKYQVKHVVDEQITDNLGRPGYRVFRYIRDSAEALSWTEAQPWLQLDAYYIILAGDQVELIEDNLRVIKLHLPVREGFSWKGNTHLAADPYMTLFGLFSNDDNMADWNFTYYAFDPYLNYANQEYTDVWTVEQEDFSSNVPITDPTGYASKSRSVEKYSRGIGLVYRELELWEYQPNTGGTGGGYKTGFGITQWMIDHN